MIEGRTKSILPVADFLEVHLYMFAVHAVDEDSWKGNKENWSWVPSHY